MFFNNKSRGGSEVSENSILHSSNVTIIQQSTLKYMNRTLQGPLETILEYSLLQEEYGDCVTDYFL